MKTQLAVDEHSRVRASRWLRIESVTAEKRYYKQTKTRKILQFLMKTVTKCNVNILCFYIM